MTIFAGTNGPTAAAIITALSCGTCSDCVRAVANGYGKVHCPAHEDRTPSFDVNTGEDGTVLFNCFANCDKADTIAALVALGVWPGASKNGHRAGKERRWTYTDAGRKVLAHHARKDLPGGGKSVWWEKPDGTASKKGKPGAIVPETLPLYRIAELQLASIDWPVLLCEGEPATDAAAELGAVAVSLPGGASQTDFGTALNSLLHRRVVLVSDNDDVGYALMHRVADALQGIAASVRWLHLPDIPPKGDMVDYRNAGGTPETLNALIGQAGEVCSVCSVCSRERSGEMRFPVGALPPVARALVEEGAASLACAPDMVAVPFLPMVAGVIGNRIQLQLKPGYRIRPILWAAVVADPGTAKSPAQGIGQAPLDVLQREAYEARRTAKQRYDAALSEWQDLPKKERGPKPEEPADQEHYYTTDSTVEGVAKMMGGDRACSPGFVVVRDELSGWVASFDAYRAARGGDRQLWLSMWAGAPFKSDRASRETIYVPEPAVSVAGGIQPDLLSTLIGESGERDGFVERFLYAMPPTAPMGWCDSYVSPATTAAVVTAFRLLREAPAGVVHFETQAQQLYVHWVNQNATLQLEVSGMLRGYYAKLPSQAARLALVLHCLLHPDNPVAHRVSVQTLAGALALTEYFREHAHFVFTAFGAKALVSHPLATRVLAVLDRAGGEWVGGRAMYEALGRHVKADDLQAALAELERIGLVERRLGESGPQGGRPSIFWRRHSEQTEQTEQTPEDASESDLSKHQRLSMVGEEIGFPALGVGRNNQIPPGEDGWRAWIAETRNLGIIESALSIAEKIRDAKRAHRAREGARS